MLMRVGCGCAIAMEVESVLMGDGLLEFVCCVVSRVATDRMRCETLASISCDKGDGWLRRPESLLSEDGDYKQASRVAMSHSRWDGKSGDGWIDGVFVQEGEGPKSAWAAGWPRFGWFGSDCMDDSRRKMLSVPLDIPVQ